MKTLIVVILLTLLSGCVDLDVKKTGDVWDVSYTGVFRELKDLDVTVDKEDGVSVKLGSARTDPELSEIVEVVVPD